MQLNIRRDAQGRGPVKPASNRPDAVSLGPLYKGRNPPLRHVDVAVGVDNSKGRFFGSVLAYFHFVSHLWRYRGDTLGLIGIRRQAYQGRDQSSAHDAMRVLAVERHRDATLLLDDESAAAPG